jgi:hypothetical protein
MGPFFPSGTIIGGQAKCNEKGPALAQPGLIKKE